MRWSIVPFCVSCSFCSSLASVPASFLQSPNHRPQSPSIQPPPPPHFGPRMLHSVCRTRAWVHSMHLLSHAAALHLLHHFTALSSWTSLQCVMQGGKHSLDKLECDHTHIDLPTMFAPAKLPVPVSWTSWHAGDTNLIRCQKASRQAVSVCEA